MERLRSQSRIFGLDLMRAVAITLVLIGHCSWIFPGNGGIFTQLMALSGFLGVEIFFVLSGFLIGRIIYRQYTEADFNVNAVFYFLKRRWFRTFPNYFLILMVNMIVALFVGYNVNGIWKYYFFLQNFASPMLDFFTESWSLSVEEFAYVVLPFSLLGAFTLIKSKHRPRQFLLVILGLIGVFIATKIIYNSNTSNSTIDQWNLAVKSVVIYRLDSIFIGVLAGWIYMNYHNFWQRTMFFWAIVGFVMVCFYTFGVGMLGLFIDNYPFFWNVVYLPMASVAVACFLPVLSEWHSWKSTVAKAVTFISLISYSIYLLHYGVVLQTMKNLFNTERMSPASAIIFTSAYLAITIFLSWVLYTFYEKPMMDKRDKRNLD